jgi:molybdopterin/thiamine biosynthesis adenylyltransferase
MSRSELVIGKNFRKLAEKKVAVIGIGGTGCAVAQLLSRVPLQKMVLIDGDFIEDSNLERQFLFSKDDVGKMKVAVVAEKLHSFCDIDVIADFFSEKMSLSVDLIIDCTDNLKNRLAINSYSKSRNIPWIYTGAVGSIGAIKFVSTSESISKILGEGESCCAIGVLHTLPSLVASWAVSFAVTYLTTETCESKLIRINLESNDVWKIVV